MKKVNLSDFFIDDFLSIINSHKNRIQDILNEYEIVIFMARKAICFFDALIANGEVQPTKCRVISSRVVDYGGLERFKGMKIAVVDDVVVKGTSIKLVAEKLSTNEIIADYYVIACEESFSRNAQQSFSLNKPYNHYSQSDIYRLSGLITQYIEASMRTFNVDSPIYNICDGRDVLGKLLCENGSIDLTSGLQKKYGIVNQDLYFKFTGEDYNDPIRITLNNSIIKIRFYCNDEKVIAVPFVLLPECSLSFLDMLYNLICKDRLDSLVQCDNENIQNENKYKIISYCMAMTFFCTFAKKYGLHYDNRDEYYDIIQFNMPIERNLSLDQFNSLCSLFADIEICNVEFSPFVFSNYIKNAYEYIASINSDGLSYTNWKGELIAKTENSIVFSFKDLYSGIPAIQPDGDFEYVSSVIDVFIDMGLIVPSIVHIGDNNILRAYKMGEFSRLTKEQLASFIKMIYIYQTTLDRNIDRTEFEKLCVLFFRKMINNHVFAEETEFDEGCYCIGYSYYGPRMSSSQEMYTVSKNSALITDFVERDLVQKQYGKYYVNTPPRIDTLRLVSECTFFARDYANLCEVFAKHPYKKDNNPWNQYIHTYDQFLTILAIGENRKNHILSLCAEIYQVVTLKDDMFFDEIAHLPIKQYRQKLSGIDSGLWKYRCFKGDALKLTTQKVCSLGGIDALRGVIDYQTPYDLGEKIVELRDEMGVFLYRAAYVLNKLLQIRNRIDSFRFKSVDNTMTPVVDAPKKNETIFSTSSFYYMKHIKFEIDAEIEKSVNTDGTDQTIKKYFWLIIKEARYMLDKCDMYLKTNSPHLKPVKEFAVAYSPGGNLPTYFKQSTECVVSNLTETSRVAVFSINSERDRDAVIDNLKYDTQDVDDCIYLLISSLANDYEGYVQFDNYAKGTHVVRNTKELLNKIHKLPDKKQRLFVLRHVNNDNHFTSFKKTSVKIMYKSVLRSSNYCLDEYSIERERGMKADSVSVCQNGGINYAAGGDIYITHQNNNISTEELANLINATLEAAKELSPKEQKEVKEFTDVIMLEASAKKPKKGMIKTALGGLKNIVTSEKFIDAVAKLGPVVLDLIENIN